jgi:manganese transport protein
MDGLLKRQIPLFVRRIITMIPAIVIIGIGLDPTQALIVSQVVLSFGIPFALIPLLLVTSSSKVMGQQRNSRPLSGLLIVMTGIIVVLNLGLIVLTIR